MARADPGRHRARRRRRPARDREDQGAGAPRLLTTRRPTRPSSCCCATRRAAYEPLFRLESFRVVTEKRADGRVETEATIKLWVGEQRYIRTAEGNGPVNALDRALRAAITEQHPEIAEVELTNFKVRILDEHHGTAAVTRVLLDSSDGARVVGLDRRLRERHRGVLGGARRLARVRLPAASRRRSERGRPAGRGSRRADRTGAHPAGPAACSASARRSSSSRCCARGCSRSGRCCRASRPTSPTGSGVADAVAVSSGTAALHLAVRELGWGRGDEVLTTPLSFVASSNCLLFEDARPVFCDVDPATLTIDPAAVEAAVGERDGGHPAGPHLRLAGGDGRARADRRRPRARRARGRRPGARHRRAEGRPAGARGNPAAFAFYANKQMTTGEGGMLVPRARGGRRRPQRAQPGPGAGHEVDGPRPARLQLPAHRRPGRDRDRPARAARRDARRRGRAVAGCVLGAAGGARSGRARRRRPRRSSSCRSPTAARSGAAGSSTSSGCPRDADRDARDRRARPRAGSTPGRTCPASTSPTSTASASATAAGEFPVAEDFSRALARAAVPPGAAARRRSSASSPSSPTSSGAGPT